MFHGIGTVANAVAIIVAGLLGVLFNKLIREEIRTNIIKAVGVAVIFLGIGGTLSKMLVVGQDGSLSTYGVLMLVVSLSVGTLIGELLGIEELFEKFGFFLKKKFGSGDSRFVDAFTSASLIVCIGAMAVVGSLQDGLAGDPSTLFAKSIIDFVTIMMLASSMGMGCVFSFVPILVIQGGITVLSTLVEPILNIGTVISDMSLVGNAMIACVGINLAFGKKFKAGNMVPGLFVSIAWSLISYFAG